MNDRFKFRAYSKKHKKIYEVMEIGFHWETKKPSNVTLEIPDNDDWELLENLDNIILMQSTGLKDKNGKLIYELDYVRYANYKYKVVIDKFLGISLTNILNGDTIVMDDIVLFNCEVIGNEFESNTKI